MTESEDSLQPTLQAMMQWTQLESEPTPPTTSWAWMRFANQFWLPFPVPFLMVVVAHFNIGTTLADPIGLRTYVLPFLVGCLMAAGLHIFQKSILTADALRVSNQRLKELQQVQLRALERQRALAERLTHHDVSALLAVGAIHDIRNTLTPIKAAAEELAELDDDDKELAELVGAASDHALALCERILTNYNGSGFERALQNIERLIPESLAQVEVICNGRVNVTSSLEPASVVVDPVDVVQILHNIASNSIRAKRGTVNLHVVGTVSRDRYTLQIRDDGPGFSQAQLELLRNASSNKKSKSSHGFGLLLVQRMVERNGGRLKLANHPQGGAEIRILFPTDD